MNAVHKTDNAKISMLGISGISLDMIKQKCHFHSNQNFCFSFLVLNKLNFECNFQR